VEEIRQKTCQLTENLKEENEYEDVQFLPVCIYTIGELVVNENCMLGSGNTPVKLCKFHSRDAFNKIVGCHWVQKIGGPVHF
jgi:hypothetical protein